MGWEKLKRILGLRITSMAEDNASIQQLVSQNLLNRRKNFRVQFPPSGGGGPYPAIFFLGTELILGNISAGGCLVVDDTDRLGTTVGEVISLDFIWPAFRTTMRARIVGITLDNRHLQFVDFDAQFFLHINQLVPPAMAGSRFRQVQNKSGRLAAAEMWTSHMSDTLIFGHDDSAELSIKGEKFRWRPLDLANDQPGSSGRVASLNENSKLASIYVMLANFPNPSNRVLLLMERIASQIEARERRRVDRTPRESRKVDDDDVSLWTTPAKRKREGTNG